MGKKSHSKVVFCILLAITFSILTGCGGQQKVVTSSPIEEKIGVVDLEQAAKAHPQWKQIEAINAKIAVLKQQYQQLVQSDASQDQLSKLNEEQMLSQQLQVAEKQKEWTREQEILWQGLDRKMQIKKQELEKSFQAELAKVQQEKTKELEDYRKQLNVLYGAQIVNLQLKLQFSNLSEEERKQKKGELDKLAQEQQEKLAAKQEEMEEEMDTQLQAVKSAMGQELKAYQVQEETKIKKELDAKYKVWQAKNQQEMINQEEQWKKGLESQQKQFTQRLKEVERLEGQVKELNQEKAKIQEKIRTDLKNISAEIAQKEKLKAVVVNYRVNGLAVDITAQVVQKAKILN